MLRCTADGRELRPMAMLTDIPFPATPLISFGASGRPRTGAWTGGTTGPVCPLRISIKLCQLATRSSSVASPQHECHEAYFLL